jgi:aldose 1-epimerase
MTVETPLSGNQVTITSGALTATIASVGASLRTLTHGGRDLVVPYAAAEVRPVYRGAILAPWPNRVVDGRYRFDGVDHELALTEPSRSHALHGLVAWQDFDVVVHEPDRAVLRSVIEASMGYPFRVVVDVEYRVDDHGLHTAVTGTNTGDRPAPWGCAPHPYLVAGPGRVDDWTLQVPAAEVLEVTADRLVPIDLVPVDAVEGGMLDIREAQRVGQRFIDHAYTGFERDDEGIAEVTLRADVGRGVSMRFGPECQWVQVHTADHANPAFHRAGLAVEPMTCAPDAFNTGTDRGLVTVMPGESHRASWAIAPI